MMCFFLVTFVRIFWNTKDKERAKYMYELNTELESPLTLEYIDDRMHHWMQNLKLSNCKMIKKRFYIYAYIFWCIAHADAVEHIFEYGFLKFATLVFENMSFQK